MKNKGGKSGKRGGAIVAIIVILAAVWLARQGDGRSTIVTAPIDTSKQSNAAVVEPVTPTGLYLASEFSVGGVTVVDISTNRKQLLGVVDLKPTLDRIEAGVKNAHRNDGSVYRNLSRALPRKLDGYYREYVVPTPGISGPGPQRVVLGERGEVYYTPDHYDTFIQVRGEG